ncbi:hypothetical protein BU25DRAFT_145841 [Macroventuria anomochaeta]|uniref:Uncharacterized protein n=1 Tax=Macroventuria anomochaeta TaxID=301207 RepID=A0ACB6SDA2_9PLEO|nr:uncharacterized protein BU25DRAFT_145841 [Macroventuria anomochaeta]KAF2632255.1 hypothetical protein BU25DRAFT_145841 [Macroventuria anomochaeta]
MTDMSPPKKKRRGGPRRRTGCDTCKRRHTRCDEKKPICGNCARLDLVCERIDDVWKVDRAVPAQDHSVQELQPYQHETPDPHHEAPSSTLDIFRSYLDGLDQLVEFTPPDNGIATATTISPPTTTNWSGSAERKSISSEGAFLLQTYVKTVATWMDLFDHSCTYQLRVPPLALASPLLFHCVCAFTANHLALSNTSLNASWKLVAVRHYGQALRLLIDALEDPFCETAMTGSMLLLSYEVHGAIKSEDYRRHFIGLTMLIKSRGITAQSSGTDCANFWIYCRHEIAVALANERPLVLDPAEWAVSWQEGEGREDVLGNQMMWILARVINLVFGSDGAREASRPAREAFLQELNTWRAGLSPCFIGIPYGNADDDGFRKIYFTVTAAAATAFWYHITHILLYAEPVLQDESYIPLIQDQAMEVTNITISDFPAALKVFSTHGLYYAAKHIKTVSQKARVWNVLKDIERDTGYHTRSTVKHLQAQVDQGNTS